MPQTLKRNIRPYMSFELKSDEQNIKRFLKGIVSCSCSNQFYQKFYESLLKAPTDNKLPIPIHEGLPWSWLESQNTQRSGTCVGMAYKLLLATTCTSKREYKFNKILLHNAILLLAKEAIDQFCEAEKHPYNPDLLDFNDARANLARTINKFKNEKKEDDVLPNIPTLPDAIKPSSTPTITQGASVSGQKMGHPLWLIERSHQEQKQQSYPYIKNASVSQYELAEHPELIIYNLTNALQHSQSLTDIDELVSNAAGEERFHPLITSYHAQRSI